MADKAIGIIMAIIFLAGLAAVISKKANTANVLTSLLGGIKNLQDSALSPVTSGKSS